MIQNFFYRFKFFMGSASLIIEHMGNCTLQHAVAEIEKAERLDLRYRLIVFKNEEGKFDGYSLRRKEIIAIGEDNWPLALEELYKYQLDKTKRTIISQQKTTIK